MKQLIIFTFSVCFLCSCEDIVSVPDISEEEVQILAPSEGSVLVNSEVTFSWSELEFADQYQIQIAQPSFIETSQITLDTILGDSLQTFRSFTKVLDANPYQWRVKGLNNAYETNFTTQSFEVVASSDEEEPMDLSSEIVVLIAPFDNAVIAATNVTFSWEPLSAASSYLLQIAVPDFENPIELVVNEVYETASNQSFDLEDNTSYQWRVQAINETSETVFTTQNFNIDLTEDLSEQTVVILSPEDGFETEETSINLSWEPLELATLYRVVIIDLSNDTVFLEQSVTDTDITVTFEVGSYTWAVRAENDTNNTPYTEQNITIVE